LPKDLANKMLERGEELWNMYGPTETTVWSSVMKIEKGPEPVNIGPPINNTQFFVVDKYLQPVPIGVSGELLIGGAGLARGYLNRPELNKERFIENTFYKDGSRLYKTGDLVRWLPDGTIEFLGRTDFQVKLRGYRIELGEIENILVQHKDIKEAVVTAKENRNQDKQLIAYIIPYGEKELKLNELRSFLKEKLPEYMVPAVFVQLQNFPLTPNGKIDRKALPEPDMGKINTGSGYVAPRSELELKLTGIWEKILGITRIGVQDNFFELGGHSLLAVQMFAELEKALQIKLPLVTLFEHQNISELVSVINSGNWKDKWSSLIRIKSGTRTPLFFIHGAEGNILIYKDLANHLADDQAFYALQSRGLEGSEFSMTSIEEMAAYYIKEIKKVQHKGPYNLGGYCMGGTIAYEMAQQLTRHGDIVKNVFLVETYNICSAGNIISNKMSIADKLENVKFHYDNLKALNRPDKIKFLHNKTEVLKRRLISKLKSFINLLGIDVKDTTEGYKDNFRIRDINDKAQTEYRPKKYSGKTILLKPIVNFSSGPDPSFGWNDLANGEFKIYNLDIAPRGMLYEPYVQQTAEIISKELN
jgi:thioesterase domain-containing protein/acyl carrier protein